MYSGPTRGGARGGRSEFSWEQVKNDQHRENYLGHSVLAPVGRWQKGRDINWYNKDSASGDVASTATDEDAKREARRKELLAIKQREEDEINRRLGRKGGVALPSSSSSNLKLGDALVRGSAHMASGAAARGTGANTAPLDASLRHQRGWGGPSQSSGEATLQYDDKTRDLEEGMSKDDLKAARKLARREVREKRHEEHRRRKEQRRAERESRADVERDKGRSHRRHENSHDSHRRRHSRSRTPERRPRECQRPEDRRREHSRSASPGKHRLRPSTSPEGHRHERERNHTDRYKDDGDRRRERPRYR